LNRPESRNSMNLNMVNSIEQIFNAIRTGLSFGAVIICSDGETVCPGGDLKDMADLRVEATSVGSTQHCADFNRRFGAIHNQVDTT
ncbi:enoyl-CoA hydratase/isomerase family protein, partial [Acinetobacter baumannii]|uniref:enoyl-CoA hydratase/isomerase family protein n=1 Tax=Acinetobacter baumannii TaxID=470 RepID=UPI001479F293